MPTLIEYFKPENQIALGIVYFLWAVFAVWSLSLLSAAYRIALYQGVLRALNRIVPDLVAARSERQAMRGRGEIPEDSPIEEFRGHLPSTVPHSNLIARHLENIYSAGCTESRLDAAELLRHTEREITDGDRARMSFLSVFLIIGLLGTLFGLADSVISLLDLLRRSTDIGLGLAGLLGSLKGAFAPSISGVLTSILGTVTFAAYQRLWLLPVISQLRESTINFWVPELYPTTGQMAQEAAQRSLEAAVKVTEASQHIREDTQTLAANLKSAVKETNDYAEGMAKLAGGVQNTIGPAITAISSLATQLDRFNEAMGRWAAFEATLGRLIESLTTGQTKLIEQASGLERQVAAQTQTLGVMSSELQRVHGEGLVKIESIYQVLSTRMNTLQVPFSDAATEMLNQAGNFHLYSQRVQTTYESSMGEVQKHLANYATAADDMAKAVATLRGVFGDEFSKGAEEQSVLLRGILEELRTIARAGASRPMAAGAAVGGGPFPRPSGSPPAYPPPFTPTAQPPAGSFPLRPERPAVSGPQASDFPTPADRSPEPVRYTPPPRRPPPPPSKTLLQKMKFWK